MEDNRDPKKITYKALSSRETKFGGSYELNETSSSKSRTSTLELLWRRPTVYRPVQSSTLDTIQTRRKWFKSGWRVGACTAAILATLSLAINLGATIWISQHFGLEQGIFGLYTGECGVVDRYDTWIHLAINAISTVLLSGSNYCMQCLCAPTRPDVDKAHRQRRYLDIGIPSIRNLKFLQRKKFYLWVLLGLSSIPLHLMYNSIFFGSLGTYDYNIYFAHEGFLDGEAYDHVKWPDEPIERPDNWPPYFDTSVVQQNVQRNESGNWQVLSKKDCIAAYAVDLSRDRRDVILIHNETWAKVTGSLQAREQYRFDLAGDLAQDLYEPYRWICSNNNFYDLPESKPDDPTLIFGLHGELASINSLAEVWRPYGYQPEYCVSEIVQGKCSLNFSLPIAIFVMICNILKIMAMCYVAFGIKDKPLMTIGDAVASFLNHPDETTGNACLITNEYFHTHWIQDSPKFIKHDLGQKPIVFHRQTNYLRNAASKGRRLALIILFAVILFLIAILTIHGIRHLRGRDKSATALWNLGFGTVSEQTLIAGTGWHMPSITAAILVANLPQLILSFLYLVFNSVLTAMLTAEEWSHYSSERKPLRVSTPKGHQRSTYFLQLPYRFAVPLMILSGLLHWLVSRSLFLANITTEQRTGRIDPAATVSTCGYSPIAMILTLCVGGCMLGFVVACGFWKVKGDVPIVGTCSAAIAAACHAADGQESAGLLPVQWGVVEGVKGEDGVGRCGFSAEEVERPVEGIEYA